jgi:hypothetical protein
MKKEIIKTCSLLELGVIVSFVHILYFAGLILKFTPLYESNTRVFIFSIFKFFKFVDLIKNHPVAMITTDIQKYTPSIVKEKGVYK